MLVKNSFCDAHFHFSPCIEKKSLDRNFPLEKGCSSCHSEKEAFDCMEKNILFSFGIHPQNPDEKLFEVLEKLVSEKKICAIGECGFDYYTEAFKLQAGNQEKIFCRQVELAIKNNLPLVVHCRKANEKLFECSSELKKLPGVLFHSFMGNSIEAISLIKKGIKCKFSFGKQILNGNKKAIDCIKNLPVENLLFETDAPYQTLKGEEKTFCSDIEKIYRQAFSLKEENCSFEDFVLKIERNFTDFYGNH